GAGAGEDARDRARRRHVRQGCAYLRPDLHRSLLHAPGHVHDVHPGHLLPPPDRCRRVLSRLRPGPKPEPTRGGAVMKKRTLCLDELQVESFETDAGTAAGGTVRGHGSEEHEEPISNDISCDT